MMKQPYSKPMLPFNSTVAAALVAGVFSGAALAASSVAEDPNIKSNFQTSTPSTLQLNNGTNLNVTGSTILGNPATLSSSTTVNGNTIMNGSLNVNATSNSGGDLVCGWHYDLE